MKSFKKIFNILTLIFCIFVINTVAFSLEPINVKINGVSINYEDAKPQIMNQRAMVPIRKTAESLGATIEWNRTTETMTLLKGDRTVVHTMRSRVITVNGTALTFDTPSAVVQNRMMMPVRMLSEALGNVVNWDNNTRTVNIVVDQPKVISVYPDKTFVNSGEKVTISVTANSTTDRVKIIDIIENNNLVLELNTYTTNPNGTRMFSIPWTPNVTKSTFKTLKVVPGNLNSYNESYDAYKVCAINVNSEIKSKIISLKSNKTSVGRGDEIKLTIETNSNTERVKVEEKDKNHITEITQYTLKDNTSSSIRVFETTLKMQDRGDIELRVYAGNPLNGYETTYETLKIHVGSASSSSSSLTIKDVYVLDDEVYIDENAKVIVKTSTDIKKLEILDVDDRIVSETRYASIKNSNEYIWELDVNIRDSGRNRFYIIAYNENNERVKDSININSHIYSKNDLVILNAEQKDLGAISGDTVKFTIKTTSPAVKLKVMDGSTEIESTTDYVNEGSFKVWSVRIKVTSYNKDNLKIVAYDSKDNTITKRLNIYLDESSMGKIYSVDVKTPEVYKNDYIRVTVYTNEAISKVWIADSQDVNITTKKTSYDDKSGNEYLWDFKFPAEEVGSSIRYTVYAEDENGKKFDETFRVRVLR